MKYYVVVQNSRGDNLGIFETFEKAVEYCEKNKAMLISSYKIQLMPKKGIL